MTGKWAVHFNGYDRYNGIILHLPKTPLPLLTNN